MYRLTSRLWIASAALLLSAAAIVAGALRAGATRPDSSTLQLGAIEGEGNRMQIRWHPGLERVRASQGGILEVQDGKELKRFPVQPSVLQAGALDYVRQTDDVSVSLLLYENGQPGMHGVLRSVGPVIALPPANKVVRPSGERSRKLDRPAKKKARTASSRRSARSR